MKSRFELNRRNNETKKQKKEQKKVKNMAKYYNYRGQLWKANEEKKNVEKKYEYKGEKNTSKYKFFVEVCKRSQKDLKKSLVKFLSKYYKELVQGDGFIYAKGDVPVMLTAHLDTVHTEEVKDFYDYTDSNGDHIISSPQGIGGDDRAGVYIICLVLNNTKLRPSILFCEDEEIGSVGAKKFIKTGYLEEVKKLNYIIELDRANNEDAVFYDCDNPEFTDYILEETSYKEASGSWSDISAICPAAKIAGVNLSCGYHSPHTVRETVNMQECHKTYLTVVKLLNNEVEKKNVKQFEFIEAVSPYGLGFYGNYSRNYNGYGGQNYLWGDDYDYNSYTPSFQTKDWEVEFYDNGGEYKVEVVKATNYYEAIGKFMSEFTDICFSQLVDVRRHYQGLK